MATKAPVKKAAPAKKAAVKVTSPSSHMSDKSYMAHDDMHTLKRAEQIKSDPSRHSAAVHHAKSELASLQKVARKKV